MSQSDRSRDKFTGTNAGPTTPFPGRFFNAALTQGTATPREEPYVEPEYLDKPVLDIYDAGGMLQYALLEEPDSGIAWIRTHKDNLVDVEAHR